MDRQWFDLTPYYIFGGTLIGLILAIAIRKTIIIRRRARLEDGQFDSLHSDQDI